MFCGYTELSKNHVSDTENCKDYYCDWQRKRYKAEKVFFRGHSVEGHSKPSFGIYKLNIEPFGELESTLILHPII